jgi:hypothetical protein
MQSRVLYNLLQTPAEGEEGWPRKCCELIFRVFLAVLTKYRKRFDVAKIFFYCAYLVRERRIL